MSITNEDKVFLAKWVDGKLVFFTQNDDDNPGTVHFGVNDDGIDVKFFGATNGVYVEWDESGDQWNLVGATLVSDAAMTGITPTTDYHLSTKKYVDDEVTTATAAYVAADTTLSGELYTGYTTYADAAITALVDGAPGALDTLNELAASINDDAGAYATLIAADTTLSGELYAGYVAADAVVTAAHVAADTALEATISGAYVAADTVVSNAYIAADVVVTSAFGAADTTLSGNLQTNIDNVLSAGISGWFDDGTNFRATVTNGLITALAATTSGGYSVS